MDRTRFAALWRRLDLRGDPNPVFDSLVQAYTDPARSYHNATHLADCLAQLDLEPGTAIHPDEVELALWFHDAVYDPQATDNEARSATWAQETLIAAEAPEARCERVQSLILATQHKSPPKGRDAEVIVDVDLSILGRSPEEFAEFEQRIRREYSWVPEADYRLGRRAVLVSLLARNPLYSTAPYRRRYEERARQNLGSLITRLSGP